MAEEERIDAVWRDVHRGRVWRAQACRIVEESPETIVLWIPAGAPAMVPGGGLRIPGDDWELVETAPKRDQICVARPGRAHSVYVFWDDDGQVEHWYVNFEQPLRRTLVGFDTFDEKLDLIVRTDGSYRWKDEDELEQAAAAGLLDADEVRAEAQRVLEEWPFPTGWEDWRPDPSWPRPRLPQGWDHVG
jgi:predicted RNA-binding protein associated with RNAse of E/G family